MITTLKDLQAAFKLCQKFGITKADFKNLSFELLPETEKKMVMEEEEKPFSNPFAHDPSFYNEPSTAELDALLTQNEHV